MQRRRRPLVTGTHSQRLMNVVWAAVAVWLKAYASHFYTERQRENKKFNDFFFRQIEKNSNDRYGTKPVQRKATQQTSQH